MQADANIQSLFAQLRVEHFLAYLPDKGWEGAASKTPGQLRFELPDESETPYVLDLPESGHAGQSLKLMQRAIHNLCGIEDRQPREIVIEMLSYEPASTPVSAQTAPSEGVSLRVRNQRGERVELKVASRGAVATLMPHEAMEVVCRLGDDGVLEIVLHDGVVDVNDHPS